MRGTDPEDVVAAVQALFAESGYRRSLGIRIQGGDECSAVIECDVTPEYANTQGVAHGGLISGLIDTAAGVAIKFAEGSPRLNAATVSLTIHYHRPGRVGHTLRAVGRKLSGSGTPSCAIEVHDDEGVHIASGLATLRVHRS
jgi:uncharacterized protein (TIGR00369 family)